jgi:hypothetical protein
MIGPFQFASLASDTSLALPQAAYALPSDALSITPIPRSMVLPELFLVTRDLVNLLGKDRAGAGPSILA